MLRIRAACTRGAAGPVHPNSPAAPSQSTVCELRRSSFVSLSFLIVLGVPVSSFPVAAATNNHKQGPWNWHVSLTLWRLEVGKQGVSRAALLVFREELLPLTAPGGARCSLAHGRIAPTSALLWPPSSLCLFVPFLSHWPQDPPNPG